MREVVLIQPEFKLVQLKKKNLLKQHFEFKYLVDCM